MLNVVERLDAFHGHITIRTNDESLTGWLQSLTATRPQGRSLGSVDVFVGDSSWQVDGMTSRAAVVAPPQVALLELLHWWNELACFTNPDLVVHSALLADETGDGVWIAGPSGAGKSTLAAQLATAGFGFSSDELVRVEADGSLRGWPRWLAVKGGSRGLLPQLRPEPGEPVDQDGPWVVPPRRLGAPIAAEAIHPRLLVLPEHRPGVPTRLVPANRAEALAAIAPQVLGVIPLGPRSLDALAGVLRSVDCVRLTYGDGWDASRALVDFMNSQP